MQALLSFDQAPPFGAPLRFFLTAPVFGVLAGLLLLVEGPDLLSSRWSAAALAMTHLLTVGFMLQVMLGALIQILPVVAGANLRRPARVAAVTHGLLSLGVICLTAGFMGGQGGWLHAGASLLACATGVFLLASGRALWGVPSSSPTIRGLKLALGGLCGAVTLGVFLVFVLQQGTAFSLVALVDLHAAWGLGAWSAVLLVAVAYVVVPMFQLTPGYPARASWWFPLAISGVLVLWTLAAWGGMDSLLRLLKGVLALLGMAFCLLTLRLQGQRRRAKSDANSRYWQLGLLSSILALCMMLTAALWPALGERDAWSICFAILLVYGGLLAFIIGMLYKILPFLAWLHLQNKGEGRIPAPTMNRLLSDVAMQRQFLAHLGALGLLLLAAFFPEWGARPAGLGVMLDMGWLACNLFAVCHRYREQVQVIVRKLASA